MDSAQTAGCQQLVFCCQFTLTAPRGFALVPPTRLCACKGPQRLPATESSAVPCLPRFNGLSGECLRTLQAVLQRRPLLCQAVGHCWMSGPLRDSDGTGFGHRGGKSWLHPVISTNTSLELFRMVNFGQL